MELDIEVLWHTDKTKKLVDAGMDFDIDDVTWRTITFYNIDVIAPNFWDETHTFCDIHSGSEKWIAPFTYEEVKQMIAEAKLIHFNAIKLITDGSK